MTNITFSYYAHPLSDGRHAVYLYLSQNLAPDWKDSPRDERKAEADAAQIVSDLVRENDADKADRLLKYGDPPANAFLVFEFTLGVSWNRKCKCAHYSRVSYQRHRPEPRWNPVATLGMEQRDYTMGVLRKREKTEKNSSTFTHQKASRNEKSTT